MNIMPIAQLPDQPALSDILSFQLTGLVVVFGALASLWVILELMGMFFRRRVAEKPATAANPPAVAPVADGIPPDVVAAIAAAVHVTLKGRPHRVLSIKASTNTSHWAAEGRREHFSSHRVR